MSFDRVDVFVMRFVVGLIGCLALGVLVGVVQLARWVMRMLVAAAVVLCLANACHAQRLLTRGDAASARATLEDDANWNNSKKLALIIPDGGFMRPTSQGDNPDNLAEKQVGNLAYWSFTVISIVDPKNMILGCGGDAYWLSGFPTKDLSDGQLVRLVGPVMCTGTKQYNSLAGNKTVRAFRFVTPEEVAKQEQEAKDAAEAALWHTWHSKAGTTVDAKFIGWKAGKVELLTKDKRTIIVDVSALTDDDAEKAKELNRQMRAKK